MSNARYTVTAFSNEIPRTMLSNGTFDEARALADRLVTQNGIDRVSVAGDAPDGGVLIVRNWKESKSRADRLGVGHLLAKGHDARICPSCQPARDSLEEPAADACAEGYKTLRTDHERVIALTRIAANEASAGVLRKAADELDRDAEAERDRIGIAALDANDRAAGIQSRYRQAQDELLAGVQTFVDLVSSGGPVLLSDVRGLNELLAHIRGES